MWLPQVWHVILRKTALFNINKFSTKGEFLVNIHCWLSWEHILSSSFVGNSRRFWNVHNFYFFPFFKSSAMFTAYYFKKLTLGNNHFSENYSEDAILTENNSTKTAERKLRACWHLCVANFSTIQYIFSNEILSLSVIVFTQNSNVKMPNFFRPKFTAQLQFFAMNLLSKRNYFIELAHKFFKMLKVDSVMKCLLFQHFSSTLFSQNETIVARTKSSF